MTDSAKKIFGIFFVDIIFFILFFLVYALHSYFFNVQVVFYSALLDGLITVLLILILLFLPALYKLFTNFEKLLICIQAAMLGYIIAISVPTVIDRSLSFYLLEKIDSLGGSIPKGDFENIIFTDYMREHRIADVRLTEQLESKTLFIVDDCVSLTKWGAFISKFSRLFRLYLLPKHRLLLSEYSDTFVDPFKNQPSTVRPNICKEN